MAAGGLGAGRAFQRRWQPFGPASQGVIESDALAYAVAMADPALPVKDGPFWNLEQDTPIYRIHPQRYLKELLSGKLILPATHRWTDPYENLIACCGYEFIGDDGKIKQVFLDGNRFPTFGQCWTTLPESDAMWRIYSHVDAHQGIDSFFSPGEGVRLRTTARKLVNCLAGSMGAPNKHKCYMVRVAYFEEEQIRQHIANVVGTHRDKAFYDIAGHADGLAMKRTPFKHESEVRLLYIDADRTFERKEQVEFPIDVNNVIEEITLDPRIVKGGGESRRREWLKQNGFKNTTNTSRLYLRVLMLVPLYKPEDLK